jgi:hypothetical protein
VIRLVLTVLGICACLTHCAGPARAGDEVSAPVLCEVQHAIRWRAPAWSPTKCQQVAAAFNATATPLDLLGICVNESDLRETAIAWDGPDVADIGLCGVRCRLGANRRCTNGAAAGLTIRQLQRAATNIAVASAILASKASVGRYHSSTPAIAAAYEARVSVLVGALGGVPVDSKRIKGRRLRKLVEQIAAVLRMEGNS